MRIPVDTGPERSQREPSQCEPSQCEPSQREPSQREPSQHGAAAVADRGAAQPTARDERRAAPMGRDERRAAIISATLPLLRRHGQAVTTRQIAEASGVGEGTIFRVFDDKAELVDACLGAAFDQSPTLAQLAAIDQTLPLPQRMRAIVEVLQRRLTSVLELLIALGFPQPPERKDAGHLDPRARAGYSEVLQAIAELLEPDKAQLRVSPREVATMTRLFTFAATHPKINDDAELSADQITDMLLYGVSKDPSC
ncbi:MAG TPA: TetR/AcrR family transcriptional regulator [Jatrophihabitans sp.]|nr:TetR/AcrR family transcriptional regulator [Jatrophihabitans sp.]